MNWNPFSRPAPAAPRQVPAGTVVYAIGDIHGQGDLAHALLQHLIDQARTEISEGKSPTIVALGDYIDRGPDSRYVLELLTSLKRYRLIETHFLRGNHEDEMLRFLEGVSDGAAWMTFGGIETLESFGVKPPTSLHPEVMELLREALGAAISPDELAFLMELEISHTAGDYFFAHAGAAPGVAIADQTEYDLMWIRERFLFDKRPFEQLVVHGHTPTAEIHADHRRIGIDTGAYATGVLTALRLEGEGRKVIQAVRHPGGGVGIRGAAM